MAVKKVVKKQGTIVKGAQAFLKETDRFIANGWLVVPKTPAERAAILLDALPASVRLGAHDYALVRMPHGEVWSKDRWGECSHVEATIRISDHFPSPTKAAETLLHEIIHGLHYTQSIVDEDKEEATTQKLGKGLVGLFRDNPWLAGWIAGAVR